MKKIVFAFLLVMLPSLIFAQKEFDKFDGEDNVTAVVVNKKMFELMGNIEMDSSDKEIQQYLDLIKKLNNLKVFSTRDTALVKDMKSTVNAYLKKYPLEELMRVTEGGKNIKIYVKTGAKSSQILELLMFIEGGNDDTVLMSLTGNFDLSEISVLTDKMNLPGGAQLKKASKKG